MCVSVNILKWSWGDFTPWAGVSSNMQSQLLIRKSKELDADNAQE
jgi:hypothetical protein